MQFIKLSLTALCLGLITACGGSGGGGDNSGNTATPVNDNTTSPTTNVDTPSTPNTETNNTTGQVAKTSLDSDHIVVTNLNSPNLSTITVDGQTIQVMRSGTYVGSWSNIRDGSVTTTVCCGKYDSAKIGFYDLGEDAPAYLFYNGIVTAKNDIPQSGVVTYKGDSIIFPGSADTDLPDQITGTSTFNADFGNKTLSGSLNADQVTVTVNAKINENTLSGTATSSVDPGTINVDGKFYGSNAKQLAGMAIPQTENDDWGAAFIAGKQ
ncbi:transferrin-binding protein-like solute binding protein [Testudinibacter sp. TR-2022]|uniref:Slam-dependent surface lipoprotein n=1 Tax=Testudinibacter sp. TR-2022 TaxID=2585029 RepID=UPI0011195F2B|nr:Slam-dependent surface lipoprotein [Testudinibacter sp. TR-2022]TNH05164.1 transferrin-binding protein-like solute binding protein [Pasteurellaceae bacterium Phil31]TNH07383.1 transferrin-binding protein-like solute binding protein [Testudinibacter sp. TR-2022]TNH08425.1 transferrin-binding protein-like solute binding protein [Testudinibacter sp. TR-2022]TNH12567.1 transferrin-binding protein-like solute binding protein [Testudinibacter sp. TR-2022]TNH18053.1 transferrin-binding protein-lik